MNNFLFNVSININICFVDSGFWIRDSGFGIRDSRFRFPVPDSTFRCLTKYDVAAGRCPLPAWAWVLTMILKMADNRRC